VAFTDFLLILALAVVIEAATPRNHLHRMLVGLFLALAAAVLTDSVLYVLPLTALMWFFWRASSCLYGLNWPGGNLATVSIRLDLRCMLAMAVLTALLFVTLPRFGFHSLFKPTQPRMQTSGFSDHVALGDFARQLDARVVMRVESVDETSNADTGFQRQIQGRYWRGVALSRFTGQGWQRASQRKQQNWSAGSDIIIGQGAGLSVAVYREASDHAFIQLPEGALDIQNAPQAVYMDDAGALTFSRAPSRRLRLLMQVGKRGVLPFMRSPLPSASDTTLIPKILFDWAVKVSAGAKDNSEALKRMAAELRGWTYDLNAALDAAHPVVSFLQNRRGHCELYATTLALAARTLGIPARVVNGYYAGEWNEVGGFLLIRQQHAHSWVELWLDGHWQLMDATPVSRWQLSAVRFPSLDALWESVKLSWYHYVLEFQDSDRALLLFTIWHYLKTYVLWLLSLVVATGLLMKTWRSGVDYFARKRKGEDWLMLDRWLIRHGIKRELYQPLRRVAVPRGIQPAAWQRFVQQWEFQAYAGEQTWRRRELKRHLRALFNSC